MTARDALIDRLIQTIDDPGPRPGYHAGVMARHRREWPVLWEAIDRLCQERMLEKYPVTFAAPWSTADTVWAIDAEEVLDALEDHGWPRGTPVESVEPTGYGDTAETYTVLVTLKEDAR